MVLVHGSGPQSRDQKLGGQLNMGFGFQIPVFEEVAEALAAQAFVVLRYDKRSCGPFNGCEDNRYVLDPATTVESFIADAVAALDNLATRPDVDPHRLFVIGHSQDGTFVPSVLEARQTAITRTLLGEMGVPAEQVAAMAAPLEKLVGEVAAIRAGNFEGEGTGGASVAFGKSALAHGDAVPAVAAWLDRPQLLIGGAYDWNVPPAEMKASQETLANAGTGLHRTKVPPCVRHALNCVDEPNHLEVTPANIGKHVAPEVVTEITAFLREQAAVGKVR